MNEKEELRALRTRIDEIDATLMPLFKERMEIADKVAAIKVEHNLPVLDATREQQVVENAVGMAGGEFQGEAERFMRTILALSRERQDQVIARAKM